MVVDAVELNVIHHVMLMKGVLEFIRWDWGGLWAYILAGSSDLKIRRSDDNKVSDRETKGLSSIPLQRA